MPPFTPTYDRKRVTSGMTAVRLAPYDELDPAELPADTVVLGGIWPVLPQPWVPIGASAEGASLVFRRSTESLRIEEQLTPVAVETTEVEFRVEVTMAEDTLETMRVAYGGGEIVTTAAGAGQPAKKTLTLSSDLEHFALGLEARNTYGHPRRILVPEIVSIADVETTYRRAAGLRLYKVSFWSLVPIEEMIIDEITAPATA
jgi:hypothetical protein